MITLAFDDRRVRFNVRADEFGAYEIGTRHLVVVETDYMGERVEVDREPITPLPTP